MYQSGSPPQGSNRKRLSVAQLVCCIAVLIAPEAYALSPEEADRYVASARSLTGVPYQWGGRMRHAGEGIDCLGVLFLAFETVSGCGWKSYSVFSTEASARHEYGVPVPGLSPVSSDALDISRLMPGDTLLLVGVLRNDAEEPIGRIDGTPVWVWHTGMYSGNGKWIVGDHFAGKVVEVDLKSYLALHSATYQGVFVSRIDRAPKPKRCRRHVPMKRAASTIDAEIFYSKLPAIAD